MRSAAGMNRPGEIVAPSSPRKPSKEELESAKARCGYQLLELDPAEVAVVAEIESYCTVTGYLVTPVVGVVPPDLPLAPHDRVGALE